MERYLSFQNLSKGVHVKERGSIKGQPFKIYNVKDCTLVVPDHCDQVIIEHCSNSRIFIGVSSGSIFLRNCHDCTFTAACKQLRTRDCSNCTLNLYCPTEPAIESSIGMKFAPFNGAYPGHKEDMAFAKLPLTANLWYAIYDFSMMDHGNSNHHFEILPKDQWGEVWAPMGPADLVIDREGKDTNISDAMVPNENAPVAVSPDPCSHSCKQDLYKITQITYNLYLNLKRYALIKMDSYKKQMKSTKLFIGLSILSAAFWSMLWKKKEMKK